MTKTAPGNAQKRRAALSKEDRERLRLVILQQIAASLTIGITVENILSGCVLAGFKVKPAMIVAVITGELIPSRHVEVTKGETGRRYLATSGGRAELIQRGLGAFSGSERLRDPQAANSIERETRLLRLAIELCAGEVAAGKKTTWKRCLRNARARLARADRKR